MNIAFIIDPIDTLNIAKDSSFAMMEASQNKGHIITAIHASDISYDNFNVKALCHQITLLRDDKRWYKIEASETRLLKEFDIVMLRKDPPVNTEYFYLTYLLELAEIQGAKILNKPSAIRNNNEKLSILKFPEFIPPTTVTRNADDIRRFIGLHGEVILKPLDGMGGTSIFKITPSDPNTNVIVETITQHETRTIMVQKFLPEIQFGDKRVLLIDGEPIPFALARIPRKGEVRGNLAAGGKGVAMALSAEELKIASAVGAEASKNGLFLVGLDIIGSRLTEINVTCPTCMREIAEQTECNVADVVITELERNHANPGKYRAT